MTCGIRLWVLTGDKQDTAEQIGRQCHLIDNDMKLFNLSTFDGNRNDATLYFNSNNGCNRFSIKFNSFNYYIFE